MKKINIVVTAGGTSERIDNVRKITNSSTGKLGVRITEELLKQRERINKIFYIAPKNALKVCDENVEIIEIDGTEDLLDKVKNVLTNNTIDAFIHSMAVSDYQTSYVTNAKLLSGYIYEHMDNIEDAIINNPNKLTGNKISSKEDNLVIVLKPTPKVISHIKKFSPNTKLIGFKLLDNVSDEELIDVGYNLLLKNECDYVVANDLSKIKAGNHKAFIINKEKAIINASSKDDIAKKLGEIVFDKV